MLAEFFLTPQSFFGTETELNRLRECLFPMPGNHVPVICHFDKERWERFLSHRIAQIQDYNRKMLAMELFQRICDELAVYRPAINGTPSDENDWIEAARQSASDLEFDDIIISQANAECPEECHRVLEFASAEYWQQYGNPRLVGRDRQSQATVLKTICAHAHWLIIRMPQVKGGCDDEIVTIKQIIKLASQLPQGFKKSDVFIEIPIPERMERSLGIEEAANRLMRLVKSELEEFQSTDCEISISIYPVGSILAREVVAGEFVELAPNSIDFKARWYLTMNHVAVGGGEAADRSGGNSWNLHSRTTATDRFEELRDLGTEIKSEVV